ncbi:hypothetical protein PV10_00196 [Exophiala mesophila]|uniref:Mediator of RNA polymerase II transcription subunit 9 n=1 Tax=Exophiala mesophila TaxID=212818 RepID=A0A0D1ZQQ3_EXOME|nr:uncharacterized protein PV10_00196 [Exophiala mesophila]KIV96314.1 hypothetical protein PV10_00196 [Exophiala mesophila]
MPSSTMDIDVGMSMGAGAGANSANHTNTTHADIPPFPSPSTFSILPDVYQLISRLSMLQTPNPTSTPTAAGATTTSAGITSGPGATNIGGSSTPVDRFHPTLPLLEVKDLAAQIYPIKQKLAKARAAVTALPDVARSLDDQEAEIGQLERKILALKARERQLAAIAKGSRGQDEEGSGGKEGHEQEKERKDGSRDDDVVMTER